MKLFRIICDPSTPSSGAIDRLAMGACDVLQLDWCQDKACEDVLDFLAEWKKLHKYFFLDQQLKLITNAGAGGVLHCVEALGEYLREHGDPHVPITAVRGDNILPRVAEMSAEGIAFTDELTGENLPITPTGLVSVQVQVGAGPIATALDEESRIVVLGSYDPVAPFVAAGVSALDITWQNYEILGDLAIGSVVSDRLAMTVELCETGQVYLKPSDPHQQAPEFLEEWLENNLQVKMQWADVGCDIESLQVDWIEQRDFQLKGISVTPPSEFWRVKFVFRTQDGQQQVCWSQVPRDAVNVSVDTRPASEWL